MRSPRSYHFKAGAEDAGHLAGARQALPTAVHDPHVFCGAICETAKPVAVPLVIDLMPPASATSAEAFVETDARGRP